MRGLELSERFYREAAEPILARAFPELRYAAALIGWGSEVFGFDDAISTDHHFGPRFLLFLSEEDLATSKQRVSEVLADELPRRFEGFATSFGPADGYGVRLPEETSAGPVRHLIHLDSVGAFLRWYVGWDLAAEATSADWLSASEQRLRAVTSGRVFRDDRGELEAARARLAYYPHDVWLYLLACRWDGLSQQEAFVGRAAAVGDALGSAVIAARQVHALMRLCFTQERVYAPYVKWLGSAFAELDAAREVGPLLAAVLRAGDAAAREAALCDAYEAVARRHNALEITQPIDPARRPYYTRPYTVLHAERFAQAIFERIEDPAVRDLPFRCGGIDQLVADDDQAARPDLARHLRSLWQVEPEG